MVAYLQRRHYGPMRRPMRACHPRDLLEHVTAMCRYRGIEPVITRELLDAACSAYFVDDEAAGRRAAAAQGGGAAPDGRSLMSGSADRSGVATDLVARAVVIVLFSLISVNLLGDFLRTGHVTGLLLLASESLVVVLTIVRRRTSLVDRSVAGVITTAVSLAGPPLLRAFDDSTLVPGRGHRHRVRRRPRLVIVGKLALGRSFGIAPANRGVVMRGPYVLVRHPIYAGYLMTHAAFLVAHPAPWNVAVILVADGALVVRALIEERVLSADAEYQSYCRRVGWHLVPGCFLRAVLRGHGARERADRRDDRERCDPGAHPRGAPPGTSRAGQPRSVGGAGAVAVLVDSHHVHAFSDRRDLRRSRRTRGADREGPGAVAHRGRAARARGDRVAGRQPAGRGTSESGTNST